MPIPDSVRNNRNNKLVYNQVDEWFPLSFAMDIADGILPLTDFMVPEYSIGSVKEVRIIANKGLGIYRDPAGVVYTNAQASLFILPVQDAHKKVYLQAIEDGTSVNVIIFGFKVA